MQHKEARVEWVQTVPVRMSIRIFSLMPRRPKLEDEPVVLVKGVIDLSPSTAKKDLPMWFRARVQLFADGTAEILSFDPYQATIHGAQITSLVAIYEHAFARSLVDTDLRVVGVRR
jgi:hypothetical protein